MKLLFARRALALALLLSLCMAAAPMARAAGALQGPLGEFIAIGHDYDGYAVQSQHYVPGERVAAAVLESATYAHRQALIAHLDAGGVWRVYRSAAGVYQPDAGRPAPAVTCAGDTVTFAYAEGETYTFAYRSDILPEGMYLQSARKGAVALTVDFTTNIHTVNGRVRWACEPLLFERFHAALFPQSEEDVLHYNEIYAVLRGASGLWLDNWVYGEQKTAVPVYRAPDAASARGAGGKAAADVQGGVELLMTLDGWDLIGYEISPRAGRVGFIQSKYLRDTAPVMLEDIPAALAGAEACLTDDPFGSQAPFARAGDLKNVRLRAAVGAFYALVSAQDSAGRPVWGFLPVLNAALPAFEQDAEAAARLPGAWAFYSGGNLAPDVLAFAPDGSGVRYALADESAYDALYETGALPAGSLLPGEGFTWRAVRFPAARGTQTALILSYANGSGDFLYAAFALCEALDNRELLGLYQGEAGGSWIRVTLPEGAAPAQ